MLKTSVVPFTPPAMPSIALRMAHALISLHAEDNANEAGLLDAGFSGDDIHFHIVEARRLAQTLFVRQSDAPLDDRATLIERGALIVAGMFECGDGAIFAKLRETPGFGSTRDLGALYPEIIDRTVALIRLARQQVA